MKEAGLTTHQKPRVHMPSSKALRRGLVLGRKWTSDEWEAYCARTTKAERKLGVA